MSKASDKKSLSLAASELIEALKKVNLGEGALRFKKNLEPEESWTRGWRVCIGTLGPDLPRLEIYFDRYTGRKRRLFWVGFSAEKLELIGKVSDISKFPQAGREIKDDDISGKKSGFYHLSADLDVKDYGKTIVESYFETSEFFFGIYNGPEPVFDLELSKAFLIPMIQSLKVKNAKDDTGKIEQSQRGFFQRLIRDRQAKFRKRILQAYKGSCALTGCEVEACLEAAHIDRFSDSFDNNATNGMLLRADLHRLMDKGLLTFIWSEEQISARLNPKVKNDHYRSLHKKAIELPMEKLSRPSKDNIKRHALKAKLLQRD